MAEPKVRFKRDDGTLYPDLRNATIGDFYTERNERGEKGLPMLTVSIHSGISDGELDEEELGKRVNRSADVSLYKKAVKGDLVFNMMRAWQGAVGSTKSTGMVSPAYIVASPNKEIDPTFMNYYVQTKTIINRFNRLSYGALDFRKRLYWDSFIAAEVNIPVIEEQQKIADFLSSVDEVIVASEQEVANLETQKKAVMKKIFSQEVRFKMEDGSDFPEWEEKPLSLRCKFSRGQGLGWSSISEEGKNEIVLYGNLYTEYGMVFSNISYRTNEGKEGKVLSKKGDILIPGSDTTPTGLARASCILVDDVILSGDINILRPLVDDGRCLSYCINANRHKLIPLIKGSSVKHIQNGDIEKVTVSMPTTIEEQRLIADFLSDFDEAISAAKKELELWKELKKGLLQQMFV